MDCTYYTRKGQHLSFEERVTIELRMKDGWNTNQIAKDLNRSYNAIKKEIAPLNLASLMIVCNPTEKAILLDMLKRMKTLQKHRSFSA